MLNRDRRCVFVADTMGQAVSTATWLTEQGFPARVMDLMTLGGLEGLTPLAPGSISLRGLEVWVLDPDQAAEALALVEEDTAARAQRAAEAERQGPVEVVCEECGRPSIFPGRQRGTVQDCPHCGSYLDVENPGGPAGPEAEDDGAYGTAEE